MNDNKNANQVPQVATEDQKKALQFIQLLMGNKQQEVSILKRLEQIGIQVRQVPVMLDEEPVDCIVIPVQELMTKEWAMMSGIPVGESDDQ